MTLYVPGGTENVITDTYLRQFWSQSCGFSGWCGAYQLFAPPGWHADPAFTETGYCCGGHGGCANCIMTLSQAIADYPTEVTFVSDPPGAQIFIDGVEWWQGAITGVDGATFRGISPGTHTYELRMAGYQSVTGTFVLALDTPITVLPPTGSASFSSIPSGAEIFIDGADQGVKTPNTVTDVPARDHTYVLKLAGYNDYSGVITVSADQTATVEATLVPAEGCIYFNTTPAGAKIFIDDVDTGKVTPSLLCGLTLGAHTYRLSLTGYQDITGNVNLAAGQGTTVTGTLKKGIGTGTIFALGLLGVGILGAVILGSGQKTTIVNREFTRRPHGGR